MHNHDFSQCVASFRPIIHFQVAENFQAYFLFQRNLPLVLNRFLNVLKLNFHFKIIEPGTTHLLNYKRLYYGAVQNRTDFYYSTERIVMRFLLLAIFCIIFSVFVNAQVPVNWKWSSIKVADKTYEVHLTATVQNPWHIYSQTTPDGGPIATKISFNKNPLVAVDGNAKEVGDLHQKHEEVFDVDVRYFDGVVDFVQVMKLKSKVKTNISGTIEYMVCNDVQCLPPKTISFSVKLE